MDTIRQKKGLIKWNRKIHIFLGLFLLVFIWLFGFSGLLLNHHWEFAKSWEKRKEMNYEKTIQISKEKERFTLAQGIMNELNLKGNIYNLRFSSDTSQLNFIIAKPGMRYDIRAHLKNGNILINETKLDQWNIMTFLHTLRNPVSKEKGERYLSVWASVWSFCIDIVSIGLIVICLGGWYLWFQVGRRRFYFGLISITGGFILCIYFLLF